MLSMNLIKSTLADGSAVYDLLLQGEGDSVTINLVALTDRDANIKANSIHDSLEKATVSVVSWGDMLVGG